VAIHESVKLLSFRCFLMNGSHSSYVVNYDMYCIFTKRRKKCIRKVFVSFYQSVANLLCFIFLWSLVKLPARLPGRAGDAPEWTLIFSVSFQRPFISPWGHWLTALDSMFKALRLRYQVWYQVYFFWSFCFKWWGIVKSVCQKAIMCLERVSLYFLSLTTRCCCALFGVIKF